MEITGAFGTRGLEMTNAWATGAFYTKRSGREAGGKGYTSVDFYFAASRSWTGETSSNGNHAHTLSNNVLGKSNTVQPPSMKVRVKTRYK